MPAQKLNLLYENHLWSGTKNFGLAQYVTQFLVWLKKFGPAQNVFGPLKGQGIRRLNVHLNVHARQKLLIFFVTYYELTISTSRSLTTSVYRIRSLYTFSSLLSFFCHSVSEPLLSLVNWCFKSASLS